MTSENNAPAEELIDETPQVVKTDLRKFNKAEDQVNKALAELKKYFVITTAADRAAAMEVMKKAKKVETLIENKRKDLGAPFREAIEKINTFAKNLIDQIPPAIQLSKNAVLAFDTAETKKLKDKRTEDRHQYLLALGLVHLPKGNEAIQGDVYSNEYGQFVPRFSLENLDDAAWSLLLVRYNDDFERRKQEKIASLNKAKEGADFFGDGEETEIIDKQIEEVKSIAAPAAFVPSFGSGGGYKGKGSTKTWTFEIEDTAKVPREYLMVDEVKIRKAIADEVRDIPGVKIFQKDSISLR